MHLVTLLEEMPVQETMDAATDLRAAGYRVGRVIVNRARPVLVSDARPDAALLAEGLRAAGLDPTIAPALVSEVERLRRPPGRPGAGRGELAEVGAPVRPAARAEPADRPGRAVRAGRAAGRPGLGGMSPRARPPAFDVDALLKDPELRVIVTCGSGGVGKTTTAAALGLRAAEQGRRVVVLTIDPARRLAQSLGPQRAGQHPRERSPGIDGDGALLAMMLDMKRTFDEVVLANAAPDKAQQILANPFYQSLSASFAGTQEYMAMEKLSQLRQRLVEHGDWDLIVVDTPPSRSALDFLDAPAAARAGSWTAG